MQHGLEVRSPFLSVDLIQFANRLPDRLKISTGELKVLLRGVMKDLKFPAHIYRQKKQGFTFPLARWLKTSLWDTMEQALSPESRLCTDLVDYTQVQRLKQQHLYGRRNNYRILFNLIVFQKWLERYPHVLVRR